MEAVSLTDIDFHLEQQKQRCSLLQTKHRTKQRAKARRQMGNVLEGEHMTTALRVCPASPPHQLDSIRHTAGD